ncbi:MAG: hypothetical protein KBC41_00835 [Candidatus Pacebacteria bacterium]|nr:hypothetical protein [Candidatus Paceibacterota bacterium]
MKNEFKLKFNLPQNGFLEPVDLQDTQVGFSVYKERETKGFKSLFRVYIRNEDIEKEYILKPVVVSVSYGKETENGITISSSNFKRGRDWPIELISEKDYFYNIKINNFFDKNNKIISGIDILKQVDIQHLKPTRPIAGISIRTKLFLFHGILASIIIFVFNIFSGLQYFISGKKIHIFENLTESKYYLNQSLKKDIVSTNGRGIKIFEYEVEAWVAALYCSFHLFIYGLFYFFNYKPAWLTNIFTNNFLTTMYGIVSLGLANTILPKILKANKIFYPILSFLQTLYFKCAFKKFKI